MTALEELFLEIEKHAILRSHTTLVAKARMEVEELRTMEHKMGVLRRALTRANKALKETEEALQLASELLMHRDSRCPHPPL